MPHTHYRTKGIVLKKEDRGEADQIFTIFTEKYGKIEVVGRAIRKITSKLRGGIEIFSLVEVEFIQGKTYKTLTDAILIKRFSNPNMLEAGFQMADITNSLVVGDGADKKIWQLLVEVFSSLGKSLKIMPIVFFWKIIDLLGYKPELFYCLLCRRKLTPDVLFFAPELGGIVCSACCFNRGEPIMAEKIFIGAIKAIRFFLSSSLQQVSKLKINQREIDNLEVISACYLSSLQSSLGHKRG